jgi:hypothetical protein
VREATSALNQANLPFRLKVVNDPAGFTRCDAAVVYIQKREYEGAAEVLGRIYREISDSLKESQPALTKALAPGVGLAEDPGPSDSFGMHRCRLVAEGMVRAHEQGKSSVDERLGTVADRFAEVGIDPGKPYLNPSSSDDYVSW